MSYTPDAVKAKFSALGEAAESIQYASQWLLFHRTHASEIVDIWMQRLKEKTLPPSKRLSFLYLANGEQGYMITL
jgi:hypothetical protein